MGARPKYTDEGHRRKRLMAWFAQAERRPLEWVQRAFGRELGAMRRGPEHERAEHEMKALYLYSEIQKRAQTAEERA